LHPKIPGPPCCRKSKGVHERKGPGKEKKSLSLKKRKKKKREMTLLTLPAAVYMKPIPKERSPVLPRWGRKKKEHTPHLICKEEIKVGTCSRSIER